MFALTHGGVEFLGTVSHPSEGLEPSGQMNDQDGTFFSRVISMLIR